MHKNLPVNIIRLIVLAAITAACFGLTGCYHSERPTAELSDIEQMNIGTEMPRLLYGNSKIAVTQGSFGLLVYSISNEEITNRISFDEIEKLGISALYAVVSLSGTKIYIGNMDFSSGEHTFSHEYEIKTGKTEELREQPTDIFKPTEIAPGYDQQHDKYFDFNYLIGNTVVKTDDRFMYLCANTDWSMKSLRLIVCQYADGKSTEYEMFK